jgi:hypothetical protein
MASTNILALPLITMSVETGNNEDWIDSLKFVVEEEGGTIDTYPQLDLRGIHFEMEIRRSATDHEVVLDASVDDGTLSIGVPPDFGFLIINLPVEQMKTQDAGNYVGDVIARAEGFYRVCIRVNLTIIEGVTKWP